VIASAKYSCAESFDRFAKGKTTIEKRGAGFAPLLATEGKSRGVVAGNVWTDAAIGSAFGHSHQPVAPTQIAAMIATSMKAR
jgi:hypothetical protein